MLVLIPKVAYVEKTQRQIEDDVINLTGMSSCMLLDKSSSNHCLAHQIAEFPGRSVVRSHKTEDVILANTTSA